VQQVTFSGAAGGVAERFQWGCGWGSNDFRDFDMCSCVVTVAAAAQDTTEGAVLAAAGVAAGGPSGAAGAVRNITGELLGDSSDIFNNFDMCSCVVTVAAAAQDTAEGAVVTAAGVAAAILSEAAGAVRDITGELLSDAATI
jgi:hypothetical protein